jgi:hypothetical protein
MMPRYRCLAPYFLKNLVWPTEGQWTPDSKVSENSANDFQTIAHGRRHQQTFVAKYRGQPDDICSAFDDHTMIADMYACWNIFQNRVALCCGPALFCPCARDSASVNCCLLEDFCDDPKLRWSGI